MKPFRILVYTYAESQLHDKNLETYCNLQKQDETQSITRFLEELDTNIVAVDNKTTIPAEKQRNQDSVLSLVDKVKRSNGGNVYTSSMFSKAIEEHKKLQIEAAKKGWSPELMEIVEMFIAADPDIVTREGELGKKVHEYQLKKCENDLRQQFEQQLKRNMNELNTERKRIKELEEKQKRDEEKLYSRIEEEQKKRKKEQNELLMKLEQEQQKQKESEESWKRKIQEEQRKLEELRKEERMRYEEDKRRQIQYHEEILRKYKEEQTKQQERQMRLEEEQRKQQEYEKELHRQFEEQTRRQYEEKMEVEREKMEVEKKIKQAESEKAQEMKQLEKRMEEMKLQYDLEETKRKTEVIAERHQGIFERIGGFLKSVWNFFTG